MPHSAQVKDEASGQGQTSLALLASYGQLHATMQQHHLPHERRSLRFANSCKNDEHKRRTIPVHPGGPANITSLNISCLSKLWRHGPLRCWTSESVQGCPPSPIPAVASKCLHGLQSRCPDVSTCRKDDIAAFRQVQTFRPEPADPPYLSDCFSRSSTRVSSCHTRAL
jgi:hypothetical protein